MSKIIKIKVSAGAKTEKVEELADRTYKVRVSAPPEKGKANERVVELLALHFGVSKARISIISGHTARDKAVLLDF